MREIFNLLTPSAAGNFEKVNNLGNYFGRTDVMNCTGKIGKAWNVSLFTQSKKGPAFCGVNCHRLNHNEPWFALGKSQIAITNVLIYKTVFTRQSCYHRG